MNTKKKWNYITEGERAYQELLGGILGSPERRERYEEEATKLDLWLQLVRARQDAELTQAELAKRLGVSQAQVARIEKRGYEAYTLNTLRRYVGALGGGFKLEVAIRPVTAAEHTRVAARA